MKSVKLIFFDLDGTVCDTAPDVYESVNLALNEMGLPPVTMEQAMKAIGPGPGYFSRIILGEANLHRFDEYKSYFRPIYHNRITLKTRPFPGMLELLDNLFEMEIKLVVASNKPTTGTHLILNGLSISRYFDYIIGADSVENPKPHPEMIHRVCEHYQIQPEETLFLGDTDNDINAANAAGAKSCLAEWGYSSEKEELRLKSTFIAQTPMDVLTIVRNMFKAVNMEKEQTGRV